MDAPKPERVVKRPPKKNFDFNIGAVDREAEKEKEKKLKEEGKDGDNQESSTSSDKKVPEVDPAVIARADQLKRASTEYQVRFSLASALPNSNRFSNLLSYFSLPQILWFLESPYFILLSCILVIIDVRLSVQDDMSNPALTFMVRYLADSIGCLTTHLINPHACAVASGGVRVFSWWSSVPAATSTAPSLTSERFSSGL